MKIKFNNIDNKFSKKTSSDLYKPKNYCWTPNPLRVMVWKLTIIRVQKALEYETSSHKNVYKCISLLIKMELMIILSIVDSICVFNMVSEQAYTCLFNH